MRTNNVHHLPSLGLADAMRLFGLTARAIRYYEERGLIKAGRDRLNARIFDAKARRRLTWIAKLRLAGVSLPDIEEVLTEEDRAGDGAPCALMKLHSRRCELAGQLGYVDAALDEICGGFAAEREAAGR